MFTRVLDQGLVYLLVVPALRNVPAAQTGVPLVAAVQFPGDSLRRASRGSPDVVLWGRSKTGRYATKVRASRFQKFSYSVFRFVVGPLSKMGVTDLALPVHQVHG